MLELFSTAEPLYLGYLLAFALAAAACFAGSYRARQIPYADTRRGLFVFFLTSGGWAAAYIGFLLPVSPAAKNLFYQASLIVGFATVWAWLWFCSAYTGRALHRSQAARRFAVGLFSLIVLVKITNPLHGLYYTLEPVNSEFLQVAVRHGILYWVVMAVSYALAATGYLLLFELFIKTETNTAPLAGLTALTALPAGLNILGHVSPSLLDVTHEPLGVAVFAVGVLFAYVYQLGLCAWPGVSVNR